MTDLIKIDDEVINCEDFIKLLRFSGTFDGLLEDIVKDKLTVHAAKKAGLTEGDEVAPVSAGSDKERLIEELRAERDASVKAAAEAAQEAEAAAWLEAKRAGEAGEGSATQAGAVDEAGEASEAPAEETND